MTILDFFLFLWVSFALLDPDPATQIYADPCGSSNKTSLSLLLILRMKESVHSLFDTLKK